jgi:hypothetical protein
MFRASHLATIGSNELGIRPSASAPRIGAAPPLDQRENLDAGRYSSPLSNTSRGDRHHISWLVGTA